MNKYWRQLSKREQRLALATGGLLLAAVIYLIVAPAASHLRWLDAEIERLEMDLINYTAQVSREETVTREFAKIAEQHSVRWTAEEIHDGLRREIDRLSLENPPEPGEERGNSNPSDGRIVSIREIPEGVLSDSGEGYREYQIGFRTAQARVPNLVTFIRRLQESPQALRIDALQLERVSPMDEEATATFEVTRTVVDGIPEEIAETTDEPGEPEDVEHIDNGLFEQWDSDSRKFASWNSRGAALDANERFATAGKHCLRAVASEPDAAVYQEVALTGGATYLLTADITVEGAAELGVANSEGNGLYEGTVTLDGDGAHRYALRFTASGPAGESVQVRAPYIRLTDADTVVYLDNVSLKRDE